MNYIKEAKKLGFSNTAIMDTKKLVFKPEYRQFCEENQCGCYNVNPACPPECGTVESMKQRVFSYEKALVCGGHDDPRRHVRLAEYLEAIPVGELHRPQE